VCLRVNSLQDGARRYCDEYLFGPWRLFWCRDVTGWVPGETQPLSVGQAVTWVVSNFESQSIQQLHAGVNVEFPYSPDGDPLHDGAVVRDLAYAASRLAPVLRRANSRLHSALERYAFLGTEDSLDPLPKVMGYTPSWIAPGRVRPQPEPADGMIPGRATNYCRKELSASG
jgi:hypothetical protein